jgi:DNA modification methylase
MDSKALKVEQWPIERLVEYARNPRKNDSEVDRMAIAIREFGFRIPIVAKSDGSVVDGHLRLKAARKLGLAEVPVALADELTDAQIKAFRLLANRSASWAEWDNELLALELGDLKELGFDLTLTGFGEVELGALLADKTEGLTDPDDAPAVPEHPVSQTGDLWLLGKHRLLCGDSTVATDVERVLGGVEPHLMVTDPPYGVMLDPSWRDRAGINSMGKAGGGGENYMESGQTDTEARWDAVWALSPADVFYVWCAGSRLVEVHQALGDADLHVRQILIWDKGILTRTRSHYWWSHEHCLYGVRKGKTASWVGDAGQSTVWRIPSPKHIMGGSKEKNEPHPAQKPLDCMRRPIENNSSPGQAIYEPFSGSGTTIIAAEMTGRSCHAIELSPAYIDVAVKRWQEFTGKLATLDGDGRTFADIAAHRRPEQAAA